MSMKAWWCGDRWPKQSRRLSDLQKILGKPLTKADKKKKKQGTLEDAQEYFNQFQCEDKLFETGAPPETRKPLEKIYTRKKLEQMWGQQETQTIQKGSERFIGSGGGA